MDGIHLESRYRLHEDQLGLQKLLRRAHGQTIAGHGTAQLSERVQGNVPSRNIAASAEMEEAADDICKLNE